MVYDVFIGLNRRQLNMCSVKGARARQCHQCDQKPTHATESRNKSTLLDYFKKSINRL